MRLSTFRDAAVSEDILGFFLVVSKDILGYLDSRITAAVVACLRFNSDSH